MKNRFKVLRAERDWTQADLAAELDVSRQTIIAIEKGKYDPSLSLAFKAAKLFDMQIEAIFQAPQST
ncbi:MAG: putative transcriptional regulator [Glaciecola sp.]|jgi:putative transcriptional regulator